MTRSRTPHKHRDPRILLTSRGKRLSRPYNLILRSSSTAFLWSTVFPSTLNTVWTPTSARDMRQVALLHLLPARQPGISNVPHSTTSFILAHPLRLLLHVSFIAALVWRSSRLKLLLFWLTILTFLSSCATFSTPASSAMPWCSSSGLTPSCDPFVLDPRQSPRWWYLFWPLSLPSDSGPLPDEARVQHELPTLPPHHYPHLSALDE